eukprot:250317-Prymnesium_polylepis.1
MAIVSRAESAASVRAAWPPIPYESVEWTSAADEKFHMVVSTSIMASAPNVPEATVRRKNGNAFPSLSAAPTDAGDTIGVREPAAT